MAGRRDYPVLVSAPPRADFEINIGGRVTDLGVIPGSTAREEGLVRQRREENQSRRIKSGSRLRASGAESFCRPSGRPCRTRLRTVFPWTKASSRRSVPTLAPRPLALQQVELARVKERACLLCAGSGVQAGACGSGEGAVCRGPPGWPGLPSPHTVVSKVPCGDPRGAQSCPPSSSANGTCWEAPVGSNLVRTCSARNKPPDVWAPVWVWLAPTGWTAAFGTPDG